MRRDRRRKTTRLLVGVVAAALTLASSGCGGESTARSARETLRPAADGSGENLFGGKRGGTLTVYQHTDFDALDPAEESSVIDDEVGTATQRPLFSYLPNETQTLSPDLASGPAIVSSDGRTVTVHIKHGIHFSPPVNREVTSADVAYAIERAANPHVAGPYFAVYYDHIVGAGRATGGPIPGIATPNRYTIVFHLTGPYGTLFAGALSLPMTAPVPKEFAGPLDKKAPSTAYGSTYLVATGPYMVKADARGKILNVGYQPGESVTLVRNPNWNPATDSRPAYLNRIEIHIGGDPNVIGRQVLDGSHMVENDTPAPAIVKLAYQHYRDQLVSVPGAGIFYIALNNKHGPFTNINVRKALWAALNREGMIDAGGGPLTGTLATHFIYPGTNGYAQAGGNVGPPVDYNTTASGSMALATRYMKAAGYPSGRYTGDSDLTVVGIEGDPYAPVAELVNQKLRDLGFKTHFGLYALPVVFTKFCGTPAREIDVCSVGYTRDFADPQTILDPLFAGYNIVPTGNFNAGQVDNPQINMAMKAAERLNSPSARARAWAQIDRMLVDTAAAIPWEFVKNPTIESRDVRGINDLANGGYWDYAYTSLR